MKSKQKTKTKYSKKTCYNKLPTRISTKEFNEFVKPYLRKPHHGPKIKVSYFKIFNYILYVLHTGMQWKNLKTYRGEISWQTIYHYHNRWSKDGSYQKLFEFSVNVLEEIGKLDLSVLYGDGTNVVAKKGEKK